MIGGATGRPVPNSTGPGTATPIPHSGPSSVAQLSYSCPKSSSTRCRTTSGPSATCKGVADIEAAGKEFKHYQEQVIENAQVMAKVLKERGLRIVSGRTESHVFLVDLQAKNLTGKDAEAALGKAHITVNKNSIPNDPQKPFVTSGIRIGTPAMTTRGFTEIEAEHLANLIADVLDAPHDEAVLARVAKEAQAMCAKYPVYGK